MRKPRTPRYTLIKGQYSIHNPDKPRQGPQPDGDTITFVPDSVDLVRGLRRLSGMAPDIRNGHINVRYEGIDALETHFLGEHQNLTFANAARKRNLALLGFTHVVFFPDLPNVVQSVDQNPLPGYVIANGIEANGRLLGLVFGGTTALTDGKRLFVDGATLDQSVNAQLVVDGLVYVEPYDSMPMALVQILRARVAAARAGTGCGQVRTSPRKRPPAFQVLPMRKSSSCGQSSIDGSFRISAKVIRDSDSLTPGFATIRFVETIPCVCPTAKRATCTTRI
jgi:hypothetical protein